jgi:hypothetical protein
VERVAVLARVALLEEDNAALRASAGEREQNPTEIINARRAGERELWMARHREEMVQEVRDRVPFLARHFAYAEVALALAGRAHDPQQQRIMIARRGDHHGRAETAMQALIRISDAAGPELKCVTLLPRAGRMRYETYMYNISQRIVADNDTRAGALGTMFQEHLHSLLRRGCHGEARLRTLDLSMNSAFVKQQLRAMAGVGPALGSCNKREQGAEVTFPPCRPGEWTIPDLGSVMRQVVASLRRTMVFLPDAVVDQLATQGVDVRDLSEFDPSPSGVRAPSFLHEVIPMEILVPPRRGGGSATTGQARITATAGLGQRKWQMAAAQMAGP